MLGIEAITTKHVFTGDLSETCSCGHEPMSCKDDVVCTESAGTYDIDMGLCVNVVTGMMEYLVSGEGMHLFCVVKMVAFEGVLSYPVSVGN